MNPRFHLYIPDECKTPIFELAIKVREENNPTIRKRDKFRLFANQKMVEYGLASPVDLQQEWARCIRVAEYAHPATIWDFWDVIASEGKKVINLHPQDGCAYEAKNQQALSIAIYTALTKSLFIQFENEPNIYECIKTLYSVVKRGSNITWNEVNTEAFKMRVKQEWSAFYFMLANDYDKKMFHPVLLENVGLKINDFSKAFFSRSDCNIGETKDDNYFFINDMVGSISSFLTGADVQAYRSVSRQLYHAAEQNDLSRLNHRRYLIANNNLLQDFFGNKLYLDNKYMMSHPNQITDYYCYRITSMQYPYETAKFKSNHGQFDRYMCGYVFHDKNNVLTVLDADDCDLYHQEFRVNQYKIISLNDEIQQRFRSITIEHEARRIFKHPSYLRRSESMWERKAEIEVHGEQVQVDLKFVKHTYTEFGIFTCYDPEDHYRAEFPLSEFEVPTLERVKVKRV